MDQTYGPTKTDKAGVSGAAEELFNMQVVQFRHDEIYHREIARLTVHGRLNHMALHFCKYVGQLAEAISSSDMPKIHRTIVDTFIIDLCAANAMNLRLSSLMPDCDAVSLTDLSRKLAHAATSRADHQNTSIHWLISAFAIEAGRVSRACEKIDHLEAFTYRENIASAVGSIGSLCLIAAQGFDFPLAYEVRKRLREVEEKFVFHNVL